jgi:hypothetical protein
MTLAPAYAACRQLLAARPDLPLLMHDDPGWSATDTCNQDRPFVILSAQQRGVEIYARPRGGSTARDIGFTVFVRYPLYDAQMIGDDLADRGFAGELLAAVEAKCAELAAAR